MKSRIPWALDPLFLTAAVLPLVSNPARAEPVRGIESRLELLADDWLVERLDGAAFRLHHPACEQTVFRFDKPWEGGLSGYVTILHDGERYRLYYRGGGDLVREYTCLAFSDDGIDFTRPELGLFEFEGSRKNNIIWTGEKKAYWESHNFTPFIDANPDAPPAERWKAVTLSRAIPKGEKEQRKVLFAFVSPDGIHWQRLGDEPIITEGGFDSHNTAFWDAARGRYVCYVRQGRDGKRNVALSTSDDFRHWSKPQPLDYDGAPIEQFYTNGILPYARAPHILLGFPMRFVPPSQRNTIGYEKHKTDGLSDAVFMSSHDGLNFKRTFMEAFIRPGLDRSRWGGAHGNNTPVWGLVPAGENELAIYWMVNYDNYPEDTGRIPEIVRGTLRKDGFVSIFGPYEGGEFVTRPFTFEGKQLTINCSTSAVGSIRVEIQHADGTPVPGHTLDDCVEIWGDEIDRLVAWKNGPDVGALAGKPIRLRFALADADVYSLRFLPSRN